MLERWSVLVQHKHLSMYSRNRPEKRPRNGSMKTFIPTHFFKFEGLFIDKDTISNFTTKFEQLFEEKPKRDNVISHIKVACADSHHMMSLQINKRQNKYIKRALSILKDKYSDNNLNLKGISSELGISQAYLSTLFNNCMGVSFSTYKEVFPKGFRAFSISPQ